MPCLSEDPARLAKAAFELPGYLDAGDSTEAL
jgi:hypothetical protein